MDLIPQAGSSEEEAEEDEGSRLLESRLSSVRKATPRRGAMSPREELEQMRATGQAVCRLCRGVIQGKKSPTSDSYQMNGASLRNHVASRHYQGYSSTLPALDYPLACCSDQTLFAEKPCLAKRHRRPLRSIRRSTLKALFRVSPWELRRFEASPGKLRSGLGS